MKNIIKMLLPVVLVAVGLVYVSYLENETNNGLQRQLDVIANHEHVHDHDTSHTHDTTHEHDTVHEHDTAHEHTYDNQIRAMLELMFELENKVNAK
jgi:ABC-type nickel/cobalt efflux system permease component RcnA